MKEFFKVILYKPLYNLLLFFAYIVPGHSIGWAIILLTILINAILWRSAVKTLQTPLQMRHHQDELKALHEKHKGDKAAFAQAQMAFYKEKGINPLGGCLPLLIQLPVLIILYQVFIAGLKNVRPDIIYSFTPHMETINTYFLGIDLSVPDKLFILPILAAVIQYFQTRHMQTLSPPISGNSTDPMAMMNKQMVYLFPVMTFFIAYRLPAGLALYLATTALISLIRQVYVVKTFVPPAKAKVTVRTKSKK